MQHQAAIRGLLPADVTLGSLEARLPGLVERLHEGREPATVNRIVQTMIASSRDNTWRRVEDVTTS